MSDAENLADHQLQLGFHDPLQTRYNCNQVHQYPSPLNASTKHTVPNRPLSDRGDELQLQQTKLPSKLPQRRRFITLAEANSASYGLSYEYSVENSASLFDKRSSGVLDLAVAEDKEVTCEQEELPAMEESNEDEFQEAVEMMKTKKKFLAQLAKHPEVTVDSQWKSMQSIESSFRESSNPARTCRFCGRDFPSSRALGGHMRVHGALLFGDCTVEQERRSPCELAETLGSANHASCKGVQGSLTCSSSNHSQIGSQEVPNQRSMLNRHHQEQEEEEQEEAEKANRIVHLSSLDYCSRPLVSPAGDELLGYGDASSQELLTGKRKSTSALYELRRNPKPNQRFFRDQEVGNSNAIWPANSYMASSIPTQRSPSPSPESATACSCSECGKVFLSCKALFGHMRCHPERDWRGIQPPDRSLELDSDLRPSTPKTSYVEINSLAENITNCQQIAGRSSVAHLAIKEESCAKELDIKDGPLNSKLLTKSEASHSTQDFSLYSSAGHFSESEPKQRLKNMEEADVTEDAVKKSGKKKSIKRVADHCPQSSKDPKDDRYPSWLTRNKRSKRNRMLRLQTENASFTSETISSQLRPSKHASQLESQDDFIVANSLMMLSNAGGLMQHLEGTACRDQTETGFVQKQDAHEKRVSKNGSKSTIPAHGIDKYNAWERGNADNDVDQPEKKAATLPEEEHVKHHRNTEIRQNAGIKYQCSTCKKCFNSHQALGGHRASHRKMKGCFAQTKNSVKETQKSNEEYIVEEGYFGTEQKRMWQGGAQGRGGQLWQVEEQRGNTCQLDATRIPSSKTKGKGHKCSICLRVFGSGQALGGHKRCHWNGDRFIADTTSVASSNKQSSLDGSTCKANHVRLAKEDPIDLNLPAPWDEDEGREATFEMSAAQGALMQDEMLPTIGDSCATSTKWNNVSDKWNFEDIMGGKKGSPNILPSETDIDASCRFDQRSPMWAHIAAGSRMSQVCMLQML